MMCIATYTQVDAMAVERYVAAVYRRKRRISIYIMRIVNKKSHPINCMHIAQRKVREFPLKTNRQHILHLDLVLVSVFFRFYFTLTLEHVEKLLFVRAPRLCAHLK